MRDDVRKAMFANMRNIKFANKPMSLEISDSGGISYDIQTSGKPSEEPRSRIVRKDSYVAEGPSAPLIRVKEVPNIEYDKSVTGPDKIRMKKGVIEQDFEVPYEAPIILGEYVETAPEQELVKGPGLIERVTEPITTPIDIAAESFGKTFREKGREELERIGSGVAEDIITGPRRIVKGTATVISAGAKGAFKAAPDILAPGAEAFGTTAGRGVADVISGVTDIMQAPNREFWTPPGYQPVWTGTAYQYQRVPRFPIEPFAVSKSLGVSMPPGMDLRVKEAALLPTLEAAKMWGGEQFITKERGYGGADTRYTSKDVGVTGQAPPIFPRVQIPDFYKVGSDKSMNWLIMPKDSERVIGRKVPPRQTQRLLVPNIIQGSMVSQAAAPVVKESKTIMPSKITLTKEPLKNYPTYPRKSKSIEKPISMGSIPRSVTGALNEQRRYESVVGEQGVSSPEAVQIQAKMQSRADYAARHTEPGSPGRYLLEKSGLSS